MDAFQFDDSCIQWRKLGDFDNFRYSILDIDLKNHIADVLFKFAAHKPIVLHRHQTLNKTFVIRGEHRIYAADGKLKEIRPVGSYTSSPANPEPHRECGGNDGAIVLFSIRCTNRYDELYELLDDQQQCIGKLSFEDLISLQNTARKGSEL